MTADRTEAPVSGAPRVALDRMGTRTRLTDAAELVVRYGLVAFILTLPLEYTSQIFRLQLARIVLLAVLLAYAYLVVVGRRQVALPAIASAFTLAAFVVYSILSWLLTRAPGSFNPLLDIAAYPVTAVLIFNLTETAREHDRAWTALLVSALAVSLFGAFLYYSGLSLWRENPSMLGRVNATFGDPNIMARFVTLAVSVAVLMFASRRLNQRLLVATAVAGAAVLPLTFSKSGFVLFPLCIVVAAILGKDWRRGATMVVLVMVVAGATIAINPDLRDRAVLVRDTIAGTVEGMTGAHPRAAAASSSPSVGGVRLDEVRTYLIYAGWAMFKDNPIAGVGFGGYQHALLTRYSGYLPPDPQVTLSHTSAITILAEEGLAGVVLFLAFLLLLAKDVFSSLVKTTERRVLIVTPAFLVIPILLFSQFEGRLLEEPYLWLVIALLYSARRLEGSQRTAKLP